MSEMRIICGHCRQPVLVDSAVASQGFPCPSCNKQVILKRPPSLRVRTAGQSYRSLASLALIIAGFAFLGAAAEAMSYTSSTSMEQKGWSMESSVLIAGLLMVSFACELLHQVVRIRVILESRDDI
jgi:DNA-directed RNA polymerase subunit RPC12/RpoP